ncbi:MAG TPA: hypothetical protein VFG68_03000 [Fimbriiglobus sp.]|nr:hypothetical protein [Fimbriiglobus sp.]
MNQFTGLVASFLDSSFILPVMDTNLLRSWLGLPPGPWPPDDRALLGLPAGPTDAADAERRALTQMGRLRPHQLVHPELVTEGMNRLAQALLAVTATATAPPRSTPATPAPRQVDYDVNLEPPPAEAVILQAEPIVPASPGLAAAAAIPRAGPVKPPLEVPPAPTPPPAAVAPEAVGPRPEDRRAAYRELAGLRSLLRAWDRLRSTVADPSAGLMTPGDVFDFLEGVQAVRDAAIHPGLDPGLVRDSAPAVAAIVVQPLPLAVFRSLVLAQRQALAHDWATARARFVARSAAVRSGLAHTTSARPAVTAAGLLHTMTRIPEWGLAVASGLVLAAIVVRLVTR